MANKDLSNGAPLEYLRAETESLPRPLSTRDTTPPLTASDRLVCVAGPDIGAKFALGPEPVIIGRSDANIVLRSSDVSRRHARIAREGAHYWLDDIGSSNGTWVNGARVTQRTRLSIGDRIQVGSTILVLTRHDELEQRLGQMQKLDAMGALVKGLAHDFNNALTVIQGGLYELPQPDMTEETRQTAIADMERAATSAASLVRRLLRLGTNRSGTSELVAIDALIEDSKPLLRRSVPDSISIAYEVAPFLAVRGSAEELRHVLLNLVVNARDAMPGGGQLTVTASLVKLERAAAAAHHLSGEGSFVHIAVSDTGIGMDEATLARVFEPYFTTKPAGKGNGLGLAMVFTTVRNHDGAIWADSAPGRGTAFHVLLPTVRLGH